MIDTMELWEPSKLVPYENNTRNHPQNQIDKLSYQIDQHGFDVPIVVDEAGVILKGHGRLLAALQLGMSKVPVLVRKGLTEKQKKAIRIGDNTISAMGSLDFDALSKEINELMSMDDGMVITLDELGLEGFNFDTATESPVTPSEASTDSDDSEGEGDEETPATSSQRDYSKPDLSQEKQPVSLYQVVVSVEDEAQQQEVYALVTERGYSARPLTI